MKRIFLLLFMPASAICFFIGCQDNVKVKSATESESGMKYGGYASMEQWGEHLVTIAACHDCHTPKKMTAMGPDFDSSRLLSGHPSDLPAPVVNRNEMESKGYTVTDLLTAWVGPWGVSYAANLTSDSTGIGNWKESQFLYALRNGKLKGLQGSRDLLPPMPWTVYRHMTDDELKAIFAYLKTTKPIRNVVPQPNPPVTMRSN